MVITFFPAKNPVKERVIRAKEEKELSVLVFARVTLDTWFCSLVLSPQILPSAFRGIQMFRKEAFLLRKTFEVT